MLLISSSSNESSTFVPCRVSWFRKDRKFCRYCCYFFLASSLYVAVCLTFVLRVLAAWHLSSFQSSMLPVERRPWSLTVDVDRFRDLWVLWSWSGSLQGRKDTCWYLSHKSCLKPRELTCIWNIDYGSLLFSRTMKLVSISTYFPDEIVAQSQSWGVQWVWSIWLGTSFEPIELTPHWFSQWRGRPVQ